MLNCAKKNAHMKSYIINVVNLSRNRVIILCKGVHALFNSFLKNGFDTDINAICCGVPQGSVLGLLLFLIYIK